MKIIPKIILALVMISTNAQKKQKQDAQAIKKMCGCFEVNYNFAETFNYSNDEGYQPSKTKVMSGLEWAGLVIDENNSISIQHILQVGDPSNPMVVKHWRQDWIYENTDFYMYNSNNKWDFQKKNQKEVKGQWSQKVYQVDDSPRYEGSGSWVHVDGKSYWENKTSAPLPRREYTTRSDYNLTMRGNRIEIKDYGWLHDQDNDKVIREEGKEDIIIAREKGLNAYVRVDDSRCSVASNWWKDNTRKWSIVRAKWNEIYLRNKDLALETKVNNKVLYKHLFDDSIKEKKQIYPLIESFVK